MADQPEGAPVVYLQQASRGTRTRICCQRIRRKMSDRHLQVPPKMLAIHTGTILAKEGKKQFKSTSDASGPTT